MHVTKQNKMSGFVPCSVDVSLWKGVYQPDRADHMQ